MSRQAALRSFLITLAVTAGLAVPSAEAGAKEFLGSGGETDESVIAQVPPPPGDGDSGQAPPPPPDVPAGAPGDVTSTGEGSGASAPPTVEGDELVIHPVQVGGGGDPATRIPPPVNGRPSTSGAASSMPVMPRLGPIEGYQGAILYPDQQVFGYSSAGYLQYNDLPAQVGYLERFKGGQPSGTCSGTVVDRALVLTAAHCVQNDECFRFWPDYFGTQARYGYWDSCSSFYPQGYDTPNQSRFVFDYALIRFDSNGSGLLGDVVGAQPVLMDTGGLGLAKYNMGYPGEGWFAGNCSNGACYPWYCSAPEGGRFDWGNGWTSVGWGCDLNGGISGGPVFAQYDGRWWIVSVNSTGGHIIPCTTTCSSHRNSWYMKNLWGPVFRSGAFDAFWNEVARLP